MIFLRYKKSRYKKVGIKKIGINYSRQKVTKFFRILVTFYRLLYCRLFLPTKNFADFFLYRLNLMPTFLCRLIFLPTFFIPTFFSPIRYVCRMFYTDSFFFIFSTILMFYGLNWIPSFLFEVDKDKSYRIWIYLGTQYMSDFFTV